MKTKTRRKKRDLGCFSGAEGFVAAKRQQRYLHSLPKAAALICISVTLMTTS